MIEVPNSRSWSLRTIFGEDHADPRALLEDAELLLVYSARNGIDISSSTLSAVLGARREIASTLTPSAESALWTALDDLSRTAAPVTVFSLKVNTKLWKTVYGLLFVNVLVAVLWLQFFWFVGTTLTNDLSTLQKQAQLAAKALTPAAQAGATAVANGSKEGTETGQNQKKSSASDPLEASQGPPDTGLSGGALDDYITLQAAILAKERLLSIWVNDAAWLSPIREVPSKTEPGARVANSDVLVTNSDVLAHAPLLLGGLRLYALPLLYGLLGAFVYVLRRIAKDGELYTGEGDWIRICFGSAAGIGMGLFFGQDAPQLPVLGSIQSTASSLSPFALAFAGGYSADILFAALDRLVSAFSGGLDGAKVSPTNISAEARPNNGRRVTKPENGVGTVVPGNSVPPASGATTNAPPAVATNDKGATPVKPSV
jgi:hypothetical protein